MGRPSLHDLGYDARLEEALRPHANPGVMPARVSVQFRRKFTLLGAAGTLTGRVTGRFHHAAAGEADYPAVGDWVAAERIEHDTDGDQCRIHAVLPRRGVISRRMPGDAAREQVLATNVDVLFIVTGLDADFNVPRMERYLTLARVSGTDAVILLNKTDLVSDPGEYVRMAERVSEGAPVAALSALRGEHVDAVVRFLGRGRTGVLIGSSGAGKSTLINRLMGEEIQPVQEVQRKTERGRHTTTRREMIVLGERGILIDTPGLREVHLWADESFVSKTFADIEELAAQCRFNNCRHETEPDCAVRRAVEREELDERRLANYRKLQEEMKRLAESRGKRGRGGRPGGGSERKRP